MADVPVGVVPAPASPAVPVKPTNPIVVAQAARAAKLASVSAGLAKLGDAPAGEQAPALPVEKKVEPVVEKPVEPKLESKVEEKPAELEKTDEEHDPKTAKALAAIDKQAKKFRDEQAAAKKAFDQEVAEHRAELARQKAEFNARASSFEELQKVAKRDPVAALRKLGIESEDEWEHVGRSAFPHTKAGKAHPGSAAAVAQSAKEREFADQLAAIKKENAELRETFETTQKKAEAKAYVDQWASAAVKAIPADKPTLIAKLHAKSPEKARQALLEIGARLERDNDNETPTHAEVVAEYERVRRVELEETGVDVDALLAPAKAEPEKKAASKTLDITAPSGTRPINGSPTRAEKLAAVSAGLKKLASET